MTNRTQPSFTCRLTRGEAIASLVYLPVHVFLLPVLMSYVLLWLAPNTKDVTFNFIYYAIGAGYMLLFELKFLRREFDPLCDRLTYCLLEVLAGYGLMIMMNFAVNALLSILPADNPNNAAMIDMARLDMGPVFAVSVFLAPFVEELTFRAGVFGLLRRHSRRLAYVVGVLLFSLYHIWHYAIFDVRELLYIIQYIPASFVLCRCYERTDTVWGPIFLHMFINAMSLYIVSGM